MERPGGEDPEGRHQFDEGDERQRPGQPESRATRGHAEGHIGHALTVTAGARIPF